MKIAALDLGTNTFLCLIAEVTKGQITQIYSDEVQVVRLGQDVNKSKKFHPDALTRAKNCLAQFSETIKKHNPERILAMATSAARDVSNAEELFEIGKQLNIPIEIIPGNKEAEITYKGALSNISDSTDHYVVIDVGGGSTEFILGKGKDIIFGKSLNLGCVRLTESMISSQPISEKELSNLRSKVASEVENIATEIKRLGKPDKLLAVAGTPTELARVELGEFDPLKIDRHFFTVRRLEDWLEKFSHSSPKEIVDKYGVNPGRADVILVGVVILLETCLALKQDKLFVSTRGVRHGVAIEVEARGQ